MSFKSQVILVGYSGHGFVAADCLESNGFSILGYCDMEEKDLNPHQIPYLGSERQLDAHFLQTCMFVGIGDNKLRKKVTKYLHSVNCLTFANAYHESAVISPQSRVGTGTLVAPNCVINAGTIIGETVICNTGSIIEHECRIGSYSHIAPGAVLAGNVTVGELSFIGANSVVKQGITIGNNVTVGAGAVIIKDIPDGATVVGNPGRII